MPYFEEEEMSDEFTKFHMKELPFDSVLHHFTGIDIGGPHDHPFSFQTHILKGSYIERVYEEVNGWKPYDVIRHEGTSHYVKATCIHEIIELPQGDCWTLIIPKPQERESRFWRFDETGASSRLWHETEFKNYQ